MSKLKLCGSKLVDHSQSDFFMNFHDTAKAVLSYVCYMVTKFLDWRNKNNFLFGNTMLCLEVWKESRVEENI